MASQTNHTVCITECKIVDNAEKILIDVKALKSVLLQNEIAGLPVAIYSVAGPKRTGKSFLLNLMMRHLYNMTGEGSNKTANESLQKFFEWRGGGVAHTRGIYMMKKPLIVDIGYGEKAALFLVDTQGIFDTLLGEDEHGLIASWSFIMSSMQIFNIKSSIDSTHLKHVEKFAILADQLRGTLNGSTFFQKRSFMFLIRDWEMDEDYSLGYSGGKEYLKEQMGGEEIRAKEHKDREKYFNDTFGAIPCFLLPPPSNKIRKMGKEIKHFTLSEIGKDFLTNVEGLFEHELDFSRLNLKQIHGKRVTCTELFDYLNDFAELLNCRDLGKSVLNIVLVDAMHRLKREILSLQKQFQDEAWKKMLVGTFNENEFAETLKALKSSIMRQFDEDDKPLIPKIVKKYRNGLTEVLNLTFAALKDCKKAEELYEEKMKVFKSSVVDSFFSKSEEEQKKKLRNAVKGFQESIANCIQEQCGKYFEAAVTKYLIKRQEEVEEELKERQGQRSWFGKMALAVATGAAVVAGAGLFVVSSVVVVPALAVGFVAAGLGLGAAVAMATEKDLERVLFDEQDENYDFKTTLSLELKIPLKFGEVIYPISFKF